MHTSKEVRNCRRRRIRRDREGSMKSSGGGGNGGEMKMERKTIEKQRRMQMKSLCLHLASLIPRDHKITKNPTSSSSSSSYSSKDESSTQLDSLEEAAAYIVRLRNRIEDLKQIRKSLQIQQQLQMQQEYMKKIGGGGGGGDDDETKVVTPIKSISASARLPIVEVHHQNRNLEVVIVVQQPSVVMSESNTSTSISRSRNSRIKSTFLFHKVIRIIEEEVEEGADIVNASQSTLGDKLVYTIHSQLRNPNPNPNQTSSTLSNTLKHCIRTSFHNS